MTIIAGITGPGDPQQYTEHCRRALHAQRQFAQNGDLELDSTESAALGGSFGALGHHSHHSDPTFSLVADGRLDNRASVAADLGLSSSEVSALNDSDLLLLAWSKWQTETLDRIVGVFAFAVHDRSNRRTILVRDVLGERPLSYSIRGQQLCFASMPGGVRPGQPMSADIDALAKLLRDFRWPPNQSYLKDVVRVPPGHFVEFADGSAKVCRYWRPRPTRLPAKHDDLISAFRETMDNAVAARLSGSSARHSVTLSSGFDSSAVTGTAARLLDRPELLTAYTSAPADSSLLLPVSRFADETAIASESAAMLGIRHRVIRDETPILSSIRGLSRYFQTPAPNPVNLGWWRHILDDVRASGQSTILIGVTGNHTISYGGSFVFPAFLRRGRLLQGVREIRDTVRTHTHLRWRGALFSAFQPWLGTPSIDLLQRLFNRRTFYSEFDFVNPSFQHPRPAPLIEVTGDLVRDRLSLLTLNDNGERYKGMTAITGIDERDPTSDRRLIEFCMSMRPEHLLHRGEPRPLAREAFSDRMNPRVFDFAVRGFQSADWYSRLLQSEAFEMLEEVRTTSAAHLLNIPKLEDAIAKWPQFDPGAFRTLTAFCHQLCQALKMGLFVAEVERGSLASS